MNGTLNLIQENICYETDKTSEFENLSPKNDVTEIKENGSVTKNDEKVNVEANFNEDNDGNLDENETIEIINDPVSTNVTCRQKNFGVKRNRRKKKRWGRKPNKNRIELSSPTFFELVSSRNEKLKPILRAAKRLSRQARRSSKTYRPKQIRFLASPKYIDITPRPEKIEGFVKMPLSPSKCLNDGPTFTYIIPNEEEAKLFENLPFTEEITKLPMLPGRKRRSSTTLHPITVISSDSDDREISILPVNDQQQASCSARSNRRQSFMRAAERLTVQSKKTPKREDSKRNLIRVVSEYVQDDVQDKKTEETLFPIFVKKTKTKISPKKAARKLDLKHVEIPVENITKIIELIDIDDVGVAKKIEIQTPVDTWETVKRPMCAEKDFAPFEGLNHFHCNSNASLNDEPTNCFYRFDDDEIEFKQFSYPGSSFSEFFKRSRPEIPTANRLDDTKCEDEEEADLCSVPWVERCRPKTSKDFVGDLQVVFRLKEWLNRWKIRLSSKVPSSQISTRSPRKSKKRKPSESNDCDYDENCLECNTVIIHGPTGVGKTCLVYCLAEELGFNVIEINASSRRSYKDVVANHIGATHSHRIDLQAPSKLIAVESPPKPNSKKDIRSFFGKQKSSPIRKMPERQPEETCTSNAASIILIDDVDVIFDEDENFWNGVRDLTKDCQVPVILTSAEMIVPGLETLNVAVEQFMLTKPTKNAFVERLSSFLPFQKKQPTAVNFSEAFSLDRDLRKWTNHFQFWANFDNCIQSISSDINDVSLHNSARIMDGLKDKTPVDDNIMPFQVSARMLYDSNNKTLTDDNNEPKPYSFVDNENSLPKRQLNCIRNNLHPRQALFESDLVSDYLPYLRQMATISVQRSVERRRFRHYLYNIGFDDKWGSAQKILQESAFK